MKARFSFKDVPLTPINVCNPDILKYLRFDPEDGSSVIPLAAHPV
jgi:hypothetical protein